MTATYFIRSLEIGKHRYLSFEGTASLNPGLNLLIGRNGSGKTTLLRLIKELSDGAANSGLQGLEAEPDEVVNRIVVDRPESQTSVEARAGVKQWSGWEALTNHVRFVTSDRQLTNTANIRPFLPTVDEYQASEPAQQLNVGEEFTKAIVAELIERLEGLGEGLSEVTQEIETGYRRALVEFDKDIRIDFDRDSFVYFVDHDGDEVPVDALSAGEKEYLYFYSYLRRIQDDRNKVLLIDEPELHLHSTQVAQICGMLEQLSENNQVIAATHSSEVLQYFLPVGQIVLLHGGSITNIEVPEDMRTVIDTLGLPLDPSVFTASWVVAENEPGVRLPGGGPETNEVLGWLLGTSVRRRYWAFGSSRASVYGADQVLSLAAGKQGDISISVVFDGDRLCTDVGSYPPNNADESREHVFYLPCWELENLFLNPDLLAELQTTAEERVVDRLWRLVETNQERLLDSVNKTITKNAIRHLRPDQMIGSQDPTEDLQRYKQSVAQLEVDRDSLAAQFGDMVTQRRWQWIPGKEALGLLVGEVPDFWEQVSMLDNDRRRQLLLDAIAGSGIESLAVN